MEKTLFLSIRNVKLWFGILTGFGLMLVLRHQGYLSVNSLWTTTTTFKDAGFDVFKENDNGNHLSPDIQLDWQNVTGSKYKFGIYSAYSYKTYKEIVIIATAKTFLEEKVSCKFHYENESKITTAFVAAMSETSNKMYSGVFIRCQVPGAAYSSLPHSVSVMINVQNTTKNVGVGNIVPIQYKSMKDFEKPRFQFSLCVMPTYKFDDVFHFIEWLEYYKLMGVEQFTFYNISIGPHTSCILNSMKEDESEVTVNVFPWHQYPITNESEIRSNPCPEAGMSAAQNECLYRHKGLSKYMVFVDFDEFITTRKPQSFSQLIKAVDALKGRAKIGEYSFLHTFFYTARDEDPSREDVCRELRNVDMFALQVCINSFLLKFVAREKKIHNRNDRSKYIIRPEGALDAGNHIIEKFEAGYNVFVVSPEIAILRHYRIGDQSVSVPGEKVVERADKDVAVHLALRIAAKVKHFMKVCHFDLDDVFAGAERRRRWGPVEFGCR